MKISTDRILQQKGCSSLQLLFASFLFFFPNFIPELCPATQPEITNTTWYFLGMDSIWQNSSPAPLKNKESKTFGVLLNHKCTQGLCGILPCTCVVNYSHKT